MSRWHNEQELGRIEDLISEAATYSLLLVVPAFFGALVLSEDILGIVFGEDFRAAGLVLIVLMGEKVIQAVHALLGRSLQAFDRPDLAAYATVVSIAVNLVLNIALIPLYGIAGAAVATFLSFTVNSILHAHFLSSFLTIRLRYGEVAWIILSSLGMAAALYGLTTQIRLDSLGLLTGLVVLGALVYTGVILINPSVRSKVATTVSTLR